ncbi:hypothetical protein ONS95_001687 [Cadophora gregata]|uniref:uncharacterized protein n=1 Tax=Cadophora gregata TaxID=51156 RepID=UPI0026DB3BE8|nr:uncharacterized protein ONS95_001687 [Cadophora gregata]KAK0111321.1 hypothetical protein ONS95_001687 [Cadophora gregata]
MMLHAIPHMAFAAAAITLRIIIGESLRNSVVADRVKLVVPWAGTYPAVIRYLPWPAPEVLSS